MRLHLHPVFFVIGVMSFVPVAHSGGLKLPFEVPNFGRLVEKRDQQTIPPVCRAEREWFEIENATNPALVGSINARIRRSITVGKQLKPTDCPQPDDYADYQSGEYYTYRNYVRAIGIWGRLLGTMTTICFPGRPGYYRCSSDCGTTDLQTGKSVRLKAYLRPEARSKLEQRIAAEAAKRKASEDGKVELKTLQVCLWDDGLHLYDYDLFESSNAFSVDLTWKEVETFFRVPAELMTPVIPASKGR